MNELPEVGAVYQHEEEVRKARAEVFLMNVRSEVRDGPLKEAVEFLLEEKMK